MSCPENWKDILENEKQYNKREERMVYIYMKDVYVLRGRSPSKIS